MSDHNATIVGVPAEVMNDPRVVEAKKRAEDSGVDTAARVALNGGGANPEAEKLGLERFGIKLRKPGLMQGAMITRFMALGELDEMFQAFVWIYTLAAPLSHIYGTLAEAEAQKKRGENPLITVQERIHEWFDDSKIPSDFSEDTMRAVQETFEIVARLAPKGVDDEGKENPNALKKNPSPGSTPAPLS